MGPSGSGKTSLLNVLAGRIVLSKGSSFTGSVEVNGNTLKKDDFG
jgi:autotransporter-associated beta strand protein